MAVAKISEYPSQAPAVMGEFEREELLIQDFKSSAIEHGFMVGKHTITTDQKARSVTFVATRSTWEQGDLPMGEGSEGAPELKETED